MGFSDIAKTPVSHGVEPHDLETGLGFRFSQPFPVVAAGHLYRASRLVLGSKHEIQTRPLLASSPPAPARRDKKVDFLFHFSALCTILLLF
jgi:hypothetical protein